METKKMKRLNKSKVMLTISYLLCSIIALAQDAENLSSGVSSEERMVIGAGVSAYDIVKGMGANLKFDYLLNDKFSVGLKSMLSVYKLEDYTLLPDLSDSGYLIQYEPANAFTVMIASTFYIFGKNDSESKGGMYTSLGLGYAARKSVETIASMEPVSNNAYFKSIDEFGYRYFSCLISIGGDCKLGPGRIYFEIPYTLGVYGTDYDKLQYYETNPYRSSNDNYSNTGFLDFSYVDLSLNLGYQLYF